MNVILIAIVVLTSLFSLKVTVKVFRRYLGQRLLLATGPNNVDI